MEREVTNAPSGGSMEKPSGRTMASAFAMTNEVLYPTANKPPTSASVYKTSDSDDEAIVGMDVELATPSLHIFLEQYVSFFFILSISVFQISVVIIIFVNALKEMFGIGVSVPKSLFQTFLSKKHLSFTNFMFMP